jgi:hypothetical protein
MLYSIMNAYWPFARVVIGIPASVNAHTMPRRTAMAQPPRMRSGLRPQRSASHHVATVAAVYGSAFAAVYSSDVLSSKPAEERVLGR